MPGPDPPTADVLARSVEVMALGSDVASYPRLPSRTDWAEPYWAVVATHDGGNGSESWWCVEPDGIALFESLELAAGVLERLAADTLWQQGPAPQWDARGVSSQMLEGLSADSSIRLFVVVRLAGEGTIAVHEWSPGP